MAPNRPQSYYDVLTAAIRDMAEHGYDSAERIVYWQRMLREAAERSMLSEAEMTAQLREALQTVYRRQVDAGGLLKLHPGIGRFTLDKLRPHLHALLERRILASADLIRLNRRAAIDKTLQRFSGWGTSLPPGRAAQVDRRETARDVRKSLSRLPFEQRRVLIDQGHKLTSAINATVAQDGGAIAAEWHSHWRQAGYDYREDHKERDGRLFAVRGCWALEQGLMVPGPNGYTDQVTQPAEEPFCRCQYQYVYNLRALPEAMLTKKGQIALERARGIVAERRLAEMSST